MGKVRSVAARLDLDVGRPRWPERPRPRYRERSMAASLPPPSHLPGDLLDGRYQVEDVIGRGGHGVVYRAFDQKENKPVAVKFLHPEFAADPEYNVRMLREAQICGKLVGTAAIQVHALRSDKGGALFIVMELLEGKNLEDYLVQWEDKGAFFPLAHVGNIFEPVVHTLDLAHGQGIVHRDLKPGNIYVMSTDHGGGVRLLDFGLAKVMTAKPLTREGMVAGSPSYIAPEVWKGDPRKLDHRIDIYSLGALIFRVVAGRPPFTGGLLELMQQVLTAPRPSLHDLRTELPKTIDNWVKKALAIDADERYQKIEEMWSDFEAIVKVD